MPTITADLGSNSVAVAALAGVIDSSVPLLLLGTDSGLVGPLDQGTGVTCTITQGANTVVLTMADGTGSRLNANGVNLDLFAEIRLPLPGGLVQGAPAETIAWTGSVGGVAFAFSQTASAPVAPSSLTAAAPVASVVLTWPAAANAINYRVRRDGVTTPIYDGPLLTFTDTFPLGTSHTYTASTYNTVGESALTAPVTVTTVAGDTSGVTTLLARIPGTVQPQTGDAYLRFSSPVVLPSTVLQSTDLTALAAAVAGIQTETTGGTETLAQTLRLIRAVLAGNSAVSGSSVVFKRKDGTAVALTISNDSLGNRSGSVPGPLGP